MGAFLSGLLGAAGQDIEKQSDRAYQEKRQERMDRMKILELAASNPNTRPDALPNIFGELDDLAKDAGYKSQNKGIKNPFSQMGKMVGHILTKRQQQQQQQGQQQQARADVQGAPGVTAQPPPGYIGTPPFAPGNIPGRQMGGVMPEPQGQPAQGAPSTPPMPQSRFFTQAELDAREEATAKRKQAAELDKFTKEQTVKESLDVGTESRHYRQIQDRVAQLREKNPEMSVEDAYAIASGKAPTSGGKPMKGDVVPDAESSTGFSRIMVDHKGAIVGRTEGVLPPAGWAPSSSTTYRFVPQPDGTFKAVQVTSTHSRQIPGMPPTGVRQAPGGDAGTIRGAGQPSATGGQGFANVARPGAVVGQKPPGEGEMAIAHGAQGAMDSAVRLSRELKELPRKHPNLVGQSMGRVASLGGKLNMLPGDMRQLLADIDSIAAFTMGVHRARGRGYADKWAEAIGNPFVNPEATSAVAQRIAKIAQEVQKRILSSNRYKPTSVEEIERQMDKEGAFSVLDQPPPVGMGRSSSVGGPPATRLNPYR